MAFDGVTPEPGGRTPAPGALRLVQRFVNTVDLEDGPELVGDPAALRNWLVDAGLLEPGDRVSAADHARALELREAIRALAAAHGGAAEDADAAATISEAAARARLRPVVIDASTMRLEPETGGVDGALGRIVAAIQDAIVAGTWSRLKACDRHSCRWAFYDRSKNQSSHWCSTAGCGSREKNRRAYRRRRGRLSRGSG
jgi:predicted RNA-binding Zn ribbon-like protein